MLQSAIETIAACLSNMQKGEEKDNNLRANVLWP